MVERLEMGTESWWRFGRYEVRDGYIRPAPQAQLDEYDPWAEYHAARRGRQEKPAPYQSLLSLLDEITAAISPRDERRIADWCNQYGLLGVLPHQVQLVSLAPMHVPIGLSDPPRTIAIVPLYI